MELFNYLVVALAPLTVYRQRCKSNLSGQLLIQGNTKSIRKTGGCQYNCMILTHLGKKTFTQNLLFRKVYYLKEYASEVR